MLQVELVFKKNLPEGSIEKLLDYLEARLAAHPFIEGEEFSVGDVAVASHLLFFKVYLPQVSARSPSELHYLPIHLRPGRFLLWWRLATPNIRGIVPPTVSEGQRRTHHSISS